MTSNVEVKTINIILNLKKEKEEMIRYIIELFSSYIIITLVIPILKH